MCRTRTGADARAASPRAWATHLTGTPRERPREVSRPGSRWIAPRPLARTLSRDIAGRRGRAASGGPPAPKAAAIVADPEGDQRGPDDRRPEPAHGDRQEAEVDDGEGGHRGDVRAEHAAHVREPPGALVRGRPDELPEVDPGQHHPER